MACQLFEQRGFLDAAIHSGRESQAISEDLCQREPDNLQWRLELAYSCFWYGALLNRIGYVANGRGQLEKARDLIADMIKDEAGFGCLTGDLEVIEQVLNQCK